MDLKNIYQDRELMMRRRMIVNYLNTKDSESVKPFKMFENATAIPCKVSDGGIIIVVFLYNDYNNHTNHCKKQKIL